MIELRMCLVNITLKMTKLYAIVIILMTEFKYFTADLIMSCVDFLMSKKGLNLLSFTLLHLGKNYIL